MRSIEFAIRLARIGVSPREAARLWNVDDRALRRQTSVTDPTPENIARLGLLEDERARDLAAFEQSARQGTIEVPSGAGMPRTYWLLLAADAWAQHPSARLIHRVGQ